MQAFNPNPRLQVTSAWTLGLERFLSKRRRVLTAWMGLSPCVGIAFPAADSSRAPLSCLHVCITQHLASTPATAVLDGEGMRSCFCSTTGVGTGQSPCSGHREGPTVLGELTPTMEADLILPAV